MTKLLLDLAFSSRKKSGARRVPYSSNRGALIVDVNGGVFFLTRVARV